MCCEKNLNIHGGAGVVKSITQDICSRKMVGFFGWPWKKTSESETRSRFLLCRKAALVVVSSTEASFITITQINFNNFSAVPRLLVITCTSHLVN
jgi:hypothetical protein